MAASDTIGTAEVAQILGQSERTTRRQIARGEIPSTGKFGAARTFDRDAIVALRDARIAAERARLDELESAS